MNQSACNNSQAENCVFVSRNGLRDFYFFPSCNMETAKRFTGLIGRATWHLCCRTSRRLTAYIRRSALLPYQYHNRKRHLISLDASQIAQDVSILGLCTILALAYAMG